MRHRPLNIPFARLIPRVAGKTLVPPRRDEVPRDVVVLEQVRHGRGEESRLGGRDADLVRDGAAGGDVALVEGVAAGDGGEGGVGRGGGVDGCGVEAKHVDDGDGDVGWELVD